MSLMTILFQAQDLCSEDTALSIVDALVAVYSCQSEAIQTALAADFWTLHARLTEKTAA